MGRSKLYWILVLIGFAVTVSGILMMRSANTSLNTPGKVVGWTGIALLVIGRIFFARRVQPTKPKS